MAVLSDTDRARISAGLMRSPDLFGAVPNILKQDLLAAVDAADDWVNANTASYVAGLPEPFKTRSNTNQKSLLLIAVILMRFNLDLLKHVFGGSD